MLCKRVCVCVCSLQPQAAVQQQSPSLWCGVSIETPLRHSAPLLNPRSGDEERKNKTHTKRSAVSSTERRLFVLTDDSQFSKKWWGMLEPVTFTRFHTDTDITEGYQVMAWTCTAQNSDTYKPVMCKLVYGFCEKSSDWLYSEGHKVWDRGLVFRTTLDALDSSTRGSSTKFTMGIVLINGSEKLIQNKTRSLVLFCPRLLQNGTWYTTFPRFPELTADP